MLFKSSIQRELDKFFKILNKEDYNIREVTKGALTQSRAKLNPWAFIRLSEVATQTFYNDAEYYVWYNFRLLAVDGTRLVLPNHPSVVEEFGLHHFGPHADSPRSLALASMMYDVLNQITIDAQIAPYKESEKDLLELHLEKATKGDLLLLDRGYPSISLMYLLKAKEIEFCIRMKEDWWLSVKDFTKSGENERIVEFQLPKKDRKKMAAYPELMDKPIKCRLIKIELGDGSNEVLCTSLIDSQEYKFEEFVQLYHYRWNEEEAYKLLKARIELEIFSGKTARAIKQDFHAKVLLMNLCAIFSHPIEEKVREEFDKDKNPNIKHDQKINRTNAISMTQDILIGVFIRKHIKKALEAFDKIVEHTKEIIRPHRKEERKHRPKKLYSMNYKRL
jgi:hypothetical protein